MTNAEAKAPARSGGQRRAEILSVATTEFATKGFAGARVDSICIAAGVQRQTLYYYFSSKNELYVEVLSAGYRRLFLGLDPLIDSGELLTTPPEEGLAAFVERIFDCLVSNKETSAIIADANKALGSELRALPAILETRTKYIGAFRALIARGRRTQAFRKDIDPDECWIIMVSCCQFWWNQRYTLSAVLDDDVSSSDGVYLRRAHLSKFIVAGCLA